MQELEIFLLTAFLGTNGEIITNSNGHELKEFASVNELKITNTFFRHKEIHKMNRGYDVATDHYVLISKIRLPQKWYTFIKRSLQQEEIFRVHLLEDPSIKFFT